MAVRLTFKPNGDRVLILLKEVEKVSKGGIIMPDNNREDSRNGTVVSVGDDVKGIEKGDRVLVGTHIGNAINIVGKEYFLTKSENVLGSFKEE